ncbi:hypothetical protein OG689_43025 [Kitasatospora sp. NBC_00240]|uniref:hypothetical protein n=1 Tax=Kitasatospora sp. NBC_00240 TaxID=2903567 RepID=UPI0022595A9E|nr:hypothetical protein [Kitasatospora sp. NBC_00240]MCX5215918.1 hypothetical protein [Kitasatospora sp. NBC_00240]
MTTCLPVTTALHDGDGGEVGRAVREVLVEAGAVGERAATWVEALAARQGDGAHRRVLDTFAEAVRRVLGREIVPGGSGEVSCGLRYRLDAYVLLGAAGTEGAPDLTSAEQLALLAVGAVAATAPSTVLGDVQADLPALLAVIDRALAWAAHNPQAGSAPSGLECQSTAQ